MAALGLFLSDDLTRATAWGIASKALPQEQSTLGYHGSRSAWAFQYLHQSGGFYKT